MYDAFAVYVDAVRRFFLFIRRCNIILKINNVLDNMPQKLYHYTVFEPQFLKFMPWNRGRVTLVTRGRIGNETAFLLEKETVYSETGASGFPAGIGIRLQGRIFLCLEESP